MKHHPPVALSAFLACHAFAQAQPLAEPPREATLPAVSVNASADASAQGLSPAYPGGQVARGGRAGILGTRDHLETPFSLTSYTNELIQDRHARSVGDVLQNDPGVRVARGFGNFQESYFIRGFILGSDDVAFNGLYSLLPRQYIATELFERVEVLRGASTFLSGAAPAGGGIGGAINLLPKRAPNLPLSRVTLGLTSGSQAQAAIDLGRRFGPDQSTGVRLNAALRDGGTAVDDEKVHLGLLALGLDWRSSSVRLSADIGWQDNQLRRTRTNVTLGSQIGRVPEAPDGQDNFAQPWSYSNERDLFGTLRGELDVSEAVTLWGAYGLRRSKEANSLANLTVDDAETGAGRFYRFDNTRRDRVDTAELGARGKLTTGGIGHEWVVSAAYFQLEKDNAYAMDFFNTRATGLYDPIVHARPDFAANAFRGNDLDAPALNGRTRLVSLAVGDTLAFADGSVRLTLGARHQGLKAQNFAYGTGLPDTPYDKRRTSPMVAVIYKLGSQWSLYGNYAEALVQGDTAPATANRPGQMLSPYVSRQKEIGLKLDTGRLGLSGALFSTTRPRSLLTAAGDFTSQGRDRHQGLELLAYGEAMRGLRVLGGATWLDAEQQRTGVAATDGKRVIGVPRFQANLGVEWDVTAWRGLALDARIVHTGSRHADDANALTVPGWTRLDIGARYLMDIGGRLVTLRARIDNLTDRRYWASTGGYPGAGYLVVGGPRAFSLSGSVDF